MYKIGCIGHAGRHGEFLSRIFNREKRFDGYRFSYVFGEDEELTQEQKDERFYQVDGYCSTVDELIARSDAVMILTIPGESHLPYALKVIDAGKPVFVDKPFAATYEDAVAITEAAQARGVPLFGGSTLRHLKKLDEIKELMGREYFPFISISCDCIAQSQPQRFTGVIFSHFQALPSARRSAIRRNANNRPGPASLPRPERSPALAIPRPSLPQPRQRTSEKCGRSRLNIRKPTSITTMVTPQKYRVMVGRLQNQSPVSMLSR